MKSSGERHLTSTSSTHTCRYMHAHLHTCGHIYMHTHRHTYTYAHICSHTHVHAYVYPCTSQHKHTNKKRRNKCSTSKLVPDVLKQIVHVMPILTLRLERQFGPAHWAAGLGRNLLEMQILRTQPSDSRSETQGTPGWSPASLSLTRSLW